MPGISSGVRARSACLTTEEMVSSWLLISCSAPAPLPIWSAFTCPVTISTGEEQAYAVESPAAAFSSPGPGTTMLVPMRPVVRAKPSAM